MHVSFAVGEVLNREFENRVARQGLFPMGRKPKCRKFRTNRSGQQSYCISSISTIAPALFYLPTSMSVAWRSDVLTCKDALMPWMHDAEERPDNPVHFHHLGNCSGNCSMRCSNFLHPCRSPALFLLLAQLYLLLPWSRNFRRPCRSPGGQMF